MKKIQHGFFFFFFLNLFYFYFFYGKVKYDFWLAYPWMGKKARLTFKKKYLKSTIKLLPLSPFFLKLLIYKIYIYIFFHLRLCAGIQQIKRKSLFFKQVFYFQPISVAAYTLSSSLQISFFKLPPNHYLFYQNK